MFKMSKLLKRIGTHDGVFHCDEVMACFLLKNLPEYANADIIRSRNPEILNICDIVVDVGGVYDAQQHKYDHHQREFQHTMNSLVPSRPWKIKLSSAGLIFHHFGERILQTIVKCPNDERIMKNLFSFIYENLIQEIDGIDNGVPMFDGEPLYSINTGLSSRVKNLNPAWNSTGDSQKLFHTAMDLVGLEFMDKVHYFTQVLWPAREIVREAILNRSKTNESEEVIELKTPCPWKEHVFQLEKELDIEGQIKFVIFKDKDWRVQGVPITPNSFICRLLLEESWRGLRDDELKEKSKISNCLFVHASGFIGGNKTREGALEMALKTIKLNREKILE